jgi:tight adherence protein B
MSLVLRGGEHMDILALAAALSVMITVLLLLLGFYLASVGGGDKRARRRLDYLVNRVPTAGPAVASALKQAELSGFPLLGTLLSGKEWAADVARDLERADLRLRVGEFLTLRLTTALLLFAIAIVIAGRGTMGLLLGLVAAVVGYFLPRMYLSRRIKSRLTKFDNQLVEALSMISNSLRSGFGLLQSMDLAAEQLDPPLATEFKRTITDVNVGASFEESVLALNDRMGSKDLDIVVTAILIQRTVGGNQAEVLDTVAHTMRERSRIKGEIATLTAQQRMSGYIVGGLPIAIIGILTLLGGFLGENYMAVMFTSNAGRVALVAAGILEGVGIMLIRRILAIEV